MKYIPITDLHPHPKNPRLAPREDVVEQIAAQLNGYLDEAHALIVRPNSSGFEILSGHHRKLAAERAGIAEVPCWVREMSDAEAYMALVLNNAQSELSPLEIGLHALGSGMTQRAYAEQVGLAKTTLLHAWNAAAVAKACPHMGAADLNDRHRALAELHCAPCWLWPALVPVLVAGDWTVEIARKEAQRVKDSTEPPVWADKDAVARALVGGEMRTADVAKFATRVEETKVQLNKGSEDVGRLTAFVEEQLAKKHPSRLSEVAEICLAVEQEQADLIRARQQQELFQNKRDEEIAARIARLRRNVSLEEWKQLTSDEQLALLHLDSADNVSFNKQENDAIEWAQWSWNPVTGCQHNCPYCYARDIAHSARMAKVYPNGFEPTFRPSMLLAPRFMNVPKEAEKDTRYRNVFTCSMADLFGRWVPREWITAVLDEIRAAPQWNFLCLTKFPKRMAEFDIPPNAWMGTSVDLQARVSNAEAAFENIKAGVRWLSVEPMLEPLRFKHLDRFDWIVIGGASRSSQTPEWQPPFEWIVDLLAQARAANVKVYFKTNLLGKRLLELPFNAAIPSETSGPTSEFAYLGRPTMEAAE